MAREKVLGGSSDDDSERRRETRIIDDSLRPGSLDEVIGQVEVVERLRVSLAAARIRGETLQHILFDGPPGLGKTTLASIIPKELGSELIITSGPALTNPKDLMPYLTNLTENGCLFIDEIHRMPRAVEEFIYPAMEDFRIDIVLGEGIKARTLSMPLKRFTLIGATTRSGMLTGPLRDRFLLREHLDYYSDGDIGKILARNAAKIKLPIDAEGNRELARRSRSTPRIANALLYWVRDFAQARAGGAADVSVVRQALLMRGVDALGLDKQDRKYLRILIGPLKGGPAGVEAISATMNVPVDTLAEEIEPFLLRKELIVRTPRGRQATSNAFDHLNSLPSSLADD